MQRFKCFLKCQRQKDHFSDFSRSPHVQKIKAPFLTHGQRQIHLEIIKRFILLYCLSILPSYNGFVQPCFGKNEKWSIKLWFLQCWRWSWNFWCQPFISRYYFQNRVPLNAELNSLQDGTIETGLAYREVFFRGEQIVMSHPVHNIYTINLQNEKL